ncbi:MAG: tRNA lysidine(34) synthetase TilS [Roseibium sp.]
MPNVPDAPVEPAWLPDDQVDALFSRLIPFSNLAVAVSGGADSLCLMTLLSEWKRRSGWRGTLEVLCVDHGLRPESGEEAAFVAKCAGARNLSCTILHWAGDRPGRNIQEQARLARYRLMAAHMGRSGAQALLLAHHLDDQAETFLDRLTRGSGVVGLSAMADDEPAGPEGLRLLRPFLSVPRARLEASLAERGLIWCTDPSNTDTKYKRSRLRAIMALLEDEGLTVERIARTAGNIRRAGDALDRAVRDVFRRLVTDHPAGPLKLERAAFRGLAEELRLRLLSALIGRATGAAPRLRCRRLAARDRVLMTDGACRHTLAGVLFHGDAETLFCWREPGRTPPETLAGVTGEGVWDNRFRYRVPQRADGGPPLPALCLGPLLAAPGSVRQVVRPDGWPKAAFDCVPVVWTETGDLCSSCLPAADGIGNFNGFEGAELERLPFQERLTANFSDDGDDEGEN